MWLAERARIALGEGRPNPGQQQRVVFGGAVPLAYFRGERAQVLAVRIHAVDLPADDWLVAYRRQMEDAERPKLAA